MKKARAGAWCRVVGLCHVSLFAVTGRHCNRTTLEETNEAPGRRPHTAARAETRREGLLGSLSTRDARRPRLFATLGSDPPRVAVVKGKEYSPPSLAEKKINIEMSKTPMRAPAVPEMARAGKKIPQAEAFVGRTLTLEEHTPHERESIFPEFLWFFVRKKCWK